MTTVCINKQFFGKVFKLSTLEDVKNCILNVVSLYNSEGFESNEEYDVSAFDYTIPLDDDGKFKSSPNCNAYEIKAKREDGLKFYGYLVDINDNNHGYILDIKYESENNNFEECDYLRSKILRNFYSLFE